MPKPAPSDANAPTTACPPPLLTARQVAERCHVALRTVRRWIVTRRLSVLRLGRAVRISEFDLDQFLNEARLR